MGIRLLITLSLIVLVSGGLANNIPTRDAEDLIAYLRDTINEREYRAAERAYATFRDCTDAKVPLKVNDNYYGRACRKHYASFNCAKTFLAAIKPFLYRKEQAKNAVAIKVITNLLQFVCRNGGEKYALAKNQQTGRFFNEKGDAVQPCVMSHFPGYVPSNSYLNLLRDVTDGFAKCDNLQSLQQCIERAETDDETAHINFVESLFNAMRKDTSCDNTNTQWL